MQNGVPMTNGNIEDQTRACLDSIGDTLSSANCDYSDVVKFDGLAEKPRRLPGL